MKLPSEIVLALTCIFSVTSANFQPGLRGVFVYTYDESFTGAELFSQEINAKAFEKLLANKDFISKPKSLQSSYEFLSLLDGRCDIQLKCEKKECAKTSEKSCPAKEICPTCQKCESCPSQRCPTCEKSDCKTPPPVLTTPATATPSRPTIPSRTTPPSRTPPPSKPTIPTRPTVKILKCANGAPDELYPDCCKNGGSGKYCCLNGITNNVDCCENGGSGKYCCLNGVTNNADCCENGGKGKFCCKNGENNPDCRVEKPTPSTKPTPTSKPTPPSKPTPAKKITSSKLTPRITTPTRSATTTTTKFRGRTYIPIVNTNPSTTFEPWTGTYVRNTGTFYQSHTWVPYTHTGTWKTRPTQPIRPITTSPKYARENGPNELPL